MAMKKQNERIIQTAIICAAIIVVIGAYLTTKNMPRDTESQRYAGKKNKETEETSQDIRIWKENGKVFASNVNYPKEESKVKVIKGEKQHSSETPFIKRGGSIILPVTIENNGKSYTVKMILDTGCEITMIDAEVGRALGIGITGTSRSIVADGRMVPSGTGKADSFQVGPFKETFFEIHTMQVAGNRKETNGLLGMNFLQKHPFTIDQYRNVIRWL